jgi:amino acid adenylation domain-containing protein
MSNMHGEVPLLHDYLMQSAARTPDKVALVCGKQQVSYLELDQQSDALANTLVVSGVERGDRVLIYCENSIEKVVTFWAVLKANAVVVVINPLTKTDKLKYLIQDSRPKVLIADAHLFHCWSEPSRSEHLKSVLISGTLKEEKFAEIRFGKHWLDAVREGEGRKTPVRRCLDIDLAAIVYTSGSTGDPKGVMLTHRNMLTAATSISSYLEIQGDDVILCAMPLAFDYGLYQMIMTFRQGARLVLERSFAFPVAVLKTMIAEKVTGFPGVPTMFAMLAEMKSLHEYDFSSIRFVTNTAAALSVKHIPFLKNVFPNARIYSMYGLTECKRCTYLPPADLERKPTSVGIAIPNTELWIVDEHGNKVGPHTIGQLVIRGATVMKGYWEKPEATNQKLKPGPLPGEQVLYTGDLCQLDDDGYLYFVSRMDDVIKSRGEKVAPKEIEMVLINIIGVKEAVVIGVTDELLGQAIKAFVVLEEGSSVTERDIQKICQMRLESFMVPKYIQLTENLPRTDSGKIRKTGLI